MKFYICQETKTIIAIVQNEGSSIECNGKKMVELVANTTDASNEKHVPVASVEGNLVKVKVGSVDHPMLDEHYINWIALETKQGNQRKELKPGEKPEVTFALVEGDEPVAVYEYCNLHGLWKTTF